MDYQNKVLCVAIACTCYGTSVKDDAQTDETLRRTGAQKGSQRVVKDRLKEPIAPIAARMARLRKEFRHCTLPGLVDGQRSIASVRLPAIRDMVNEALNDIHPHVNQIVANYPAILEAEATRLQGAYNRKDYPTDANMLRGEFDIRLSVTDLPSGKFAEMTGLQELDKEALREQFRDMRAEWEREARNQVYGHLTRLILNVSDVMSDPDRQRFYDSTFDNLRSYLAMVPTLNITGDPGIEAMRSAAAASLDRSMESVKHSRAERVAVAEAANKILTTFGVLGGNRRMAI